MLCLLGPLLTSHSISQANPCRFCDMQSSVKTSGPTEVHINKQRIKIEGRTSSLSNLVQFYLSLKIIFIYALSVFIELSMQNLCLL